MLLLKAVGLSSNGPKMITFLMAREWWAQGCLCLPAAQREKKVASLGQAAACDGASGSPLARDWPAVGVKDAQVFYQLDLKNDLRTENWHTSWLV